MASARILLLVTGGIAAYKACFLARLYMQAGFSVKVAMTDAATRFVTPMTFQVLTGHPVATDLWGEGQSVALDHIEYARWADLAVVAPATANNLAKLTAGIADDMVTTQLLAFPGPVLVAPAMNDNMWDHPATQANVALLKQRGVHFVEPADGWLACGTVSKGRMAEPEDILAATRELAAVIPAREELSATKSAPGFWPGQKVLVTAGPTHEPIDPVRFLGNRSSGAMGYALAQAAMQQGARVTLITGPTELPVPRGLEQVVRIQTACELSDAVATALQEGCQWLIMTAAVADFGLPQPSAGKMKKEDLGDNWTLTLSRNPDILAETVPLHRDDDLKVVGFALETEDVLTRAEAKRKAKSMDYIVANNPIAPGSGFGTGDHQVTLLGAQGVIWASDSQPKARLAGQLLQQIADHENKA
jgi:phosphopantothenoylcysteine decarboxylase/phosphopantothenate--cysteine ligase|nr:bifunctional phosphopantothenoylcysteine decarboxylase/phosphopantothenate--cysteine ligase CoaBC [Candidatus Krumholzibacteria bacterium]